jgi:hypothetical protein
VISSAVLVKTDQTLIYEITAASELLEIKANQMNIRTVVRP